MKPTHEVGANSLSPNHEATRTEYEKLLARAITVFGTQSLAEEWLIRPCRHLNQIVPIETLDDPDQRRTVEEYLERIEFGVYQ